MAEWNSAALTLRLPDRWWPPILLGLAGLGWWWSAVTSHAMGSGMNMGGARALSLLAFLGAWAAMMAAMMLPAITPVVRLYARAAARGTVAPVAAFVAGYGVVWCAMGFPAFVLWRRLDGPLADASPTAGRIAGGVLVAAAVYQLTSLKAVCLRHCRSPLSFFMRHAKNMNRSLGAAAVGARHGLYCLGCCWMLMAVLVAFGTLQLAWMVALAGVIVLEKATPIGLRVAPVVGAAFLVLGVVLLLHPTSVSHLT